MRKILVTVITLSLLIFTGCGVNNIKTNSLDKIIITRQEPVLGELGSYNSKELKIFTSKEDIKRIVDATENARRETVDLKYEEQRKVIYFLTLYYKGVPKTAYTIYLQEDWDRAVFTNGYYFCINQKDTKWLKSFIFK